MACPREIIVESETQEFEGLNFFERVVEKVDGRLCRMVLSERENECEISKD